VSEGPGQAAVEPEPFPPPFPPPEAPPPDPGAFDPSALPPPPTTLPLAPPPEQPAAGGSAAEAQPAAGPAAPKQKRRWFWPAVAVLALALSAAELVYLRVGLEPQPAADKPDPQEDVPEPGRPPRPRTSTGPARPVKTYGSLKVVSVLSDKPYPALVEIDGVERGETPLTVEVLTGKHKVTVSRPGFQTVTVQVLVAPRKLAEVKVDLLP
jgi:hypothetical protein